MITGNNFKRANIGPIPDRDMSTWGPEDQTQDALMEKALGFNCLNYNPGVTPEGSTEYHYLRNKTFLDAHCTDGVRAEILFPSCWNGRDLDSPDHKSHVAYASRLRNGPCPDGFGTRIPTLFLETIYRTQDFKDSNGQFVFANGDPTGYGYHADFIGAWEDGVLQSVLENPSCTGPASSGNQWDCPVFDLKEVDDPETINCEMQNPNAILHESINFVEKLPGDVPVQAGPGSASMPPKAAPSNPPAAPSSAVPGSPTSTAVANANTTAAAAPPSVTPVPTSPPASIKDIITKTSVTVIDGTVYHWLILEEVVTTTVMVDTPGATGHAKRHVHGHHHNRRR